MKVNVVSFSFVVPLVRVATSLRTYPNRLIISFIEVFELLNGVVARLERAVASGGHGGSQAANTLHIATCSGVSSSLLPELALRLRRASGRSVRMGMEAICAPVDVFARDCI